MKVRHTPFYPAAQWGGWIPRSEIKFTDRKRNIRSLVCAQNTFLPNETTKKDRCGQDELQREIKFDRIRKSISSCFGNSIFNAIQGDAPYRLFKQEISGKYNREEGRRGQERREKARRGSGNSCQLQLVNDLGYALTFQAFLTDHPELRFRFLRRQRIQHNTFPKLSSTFSAVGRQTRNKQATPTLGKWISKERDDSSRLTWPSNGQNFIENPWP